MNVKRAISVVLLCLLPIVSGGLAAAQESTPEACNLEGQIIFTRFVDGQNIVMVNADGSDLTQLTGVDEDAITGNGASWSPDGERIVFTSADLRHADNIYVMDADGGNVEPLTDDELQNSNPAVSPDGAQIVFTSETEFANPDLYLMDADGGNKTPLILSPDREMSPAWSPDGEWIAYASDAGDEWSIYRISPEGGEPELLVSDAVWPVWSPDGTLLAYSAPFGGISVIDLADGSITELSETGQRPSWSPDGQWLVVGSAGESGGDLWIIAADGSESCELTSGFGREHAEDHSPAWRPEVVEGE